MYNTAKSPVKVNATYTIKPGVKLYTVPWGTFNQEASKVSGSGNQTFKATKQQQIDKATYLYGTVNGKSGWVSKYYLTAPTQSKLKRAVKSQLRIELLQLNQHLKQLKVQQLKL